MTQTPSENRKRKSSGMTDQDVKKQKTMNVRKIAVPVHRLVKQYQNNNKYDVKLNYLF